MFKDYFQLSKLKVLSITEAEVREGGLSFFTSFVKQSYGYNSDHL